ncbi:hypothetical protein COLO4_13498 [Corchorus olitorius]|uniref:Transmembrane protein n=1 Tax=Corchorus olitorius TaxID=93759 RepID=A0A1R3JWG8_9ROSI|nr:hypothetical protein COLO4_13498 [Corchorus olitorius]
MQGTLQFKSPFLHFNRILSLNPSLEPNSSLQSFNCSTKSPILPHKSTQKPILCARNSKSRYGYQRSSKFILELISLASDLRILPQPLDLVAQNLVGRDGRGLRFLNGLKGVSFNGRRRTTTRRRNGMKVLGFSVLLGSCILCLWFGKELRSELVFGVLGFGFFVAALIKEWNKGLKNWIFGVCCVGVLVGFGLSGNKGMKLIQETKISSSSSQMVEFLRRGRRRGRWRL